MTKWIEAASVLQLRVVSPNAALTPSCSIVLNVDPNDVVPNFAAISTRIVRAFFLNVIVKIAPTILIFSQTRGSPPRTPKTNHGPEITFPMCQRKYTKTNISAAQSIFVEQSIACQVMTRVTIRFSSLWVMQNLKIR